MTKSFSYSVLKYRPSYLLDEQLNIGLLFSFPEEKIIKFIAPKKLERIQLLYPDTSPFFLQLYLNNFRQKAYEITQSEKEINHDKIVSDFIPVDANSLFFTKSVKGKYKNIEETVSYYDKLYFDVYKMVLADAVEQLLENRKFI